MQFYCILHFRFVPFTIGLFLQLVTVTQKALSPHSARKMAVVIVAQALWEVAATCVRRTTSTTAPLQAASSVPTVTAWSETRYEVVL